MQYKIINGDTAEIKFFGQISDWWISSKDYIDTIEQIEKAGYKNLHIRTHCIGGSVFEGNVIWAANRRSKLNIVFKIDGMAASMMAIVMLSGARVEMSSVAKVMVHPPRSYQSGTAKDHFAAGKLLKSMEVDFKREFKRRSNLTDAQIEAMLDGADNWYDAEECMKMGICDLIYDAQEFGTDVKAKPDTGADPLKIFGQYTALSVEPFNHKKTEKMDKKAIIEKFSLTGVTPDSSDTAVMDALQAKIGTNENAAADLAKKKADLLKAEAKVAIDAREVVIGDKFTDEQRKTFETVASTGGIDVLKSVLSEIKPVANLQALLGGDGKTKSSVAEDRKDWDWDRWEKEDPTGLSKMEASDLPSFQKLYQAKWPSNEAKFQ